MWLTRSLQLLMPHAVPRTPIRCNTFGISTLFSRAHTTPLSMRARMYRQRRFRQPQLSPGAVIFGLVGANVAVYCGWNYATWLSANGDRRATAFMVRNFTSSEENLRAGRWWALLTSSISQYSTSHIAVNMLGFIFTAPPIAQALGASRLLSLYFGAGAAGALSSITWPHISGSPRRIYTHGASSSVYGILSAFACMNPNAVFLLFFVVPVPAWACVAGLLAWDTYSALNPRAGSHIDSVGHVGGLLAGVAYWKLMPFL